MSKFDTAADGLYRQGLNAWRDGMDISAEMARVAKVISEDHPNLSERAHLAFLQAYRQGLDDARADWNAPSTIILNSPWTGAPNRIDGDQAILAQRRAKALG